MFILVLDENEERRAKLTKVIRERWRFPVVGNPGLDVGTVVSRRLDRLPGGKVLWRSPCRVDELWEAFGDFRSEIELVRIEEDQSRLYARLAQVVIPPSADEDEIEHELTDRFGDPPEPPAVPTLDELAASDLRLHRLVKNLGHDGTTIIQELVFQIFPEARGPISLKWVGEGYSSSVLLQLAFSDQRGHKRYRVLKLTPASERPKCVAELNNYPKTDLDQAKMSGTLVPSIFCNESGAGTENGEPGVAEYGNWVAVAYDLIGTEDQNFCDLAESYFERDDVRKSGFQDADDPARNVLEWCLSRIRTQWYALGEFTDLQLWTGEDKANISDRYCMPPYGFTSAEKRRITKELRSLGSYGQCVLQSSYEPDFEVVTRVVWDGLAKSHFVPVMLSRIHGDMNGGNLRCNIDQGQGFFIDLARHHPSSHTLQDFARLEVEIKYVFMDAGPGSGSTHRDLNPTSFSLWTLVEEAMLPDDWSRNLEVAADASGCVHRAVSLINYVRREAFQTQQNRQNELGLSTSSSQYFQTAYRAALLYETIWAITWGALPIVKRLLATHSAARLAEFLER